MWETVNPKVNMHTMMGGGVGTRVQSPSNSQISKICFASLPVSILLFSPITVQYSHVKVDLLTFLCDSQFAIHLGIAPGSRGISLEQTGKNHGYRDRDVCAFCPVNHCCIEGGPDRLDSIIDMRSLSKDLKQMGLDVIYSRDAGRYLCDFVYYCSLHHGHVRAAFIHVPASGSMATPDRLVPLLQTVIQAMLNHMEYSQVCGNS
uniref:Pyroglutamyl-peptidase I like n=1 Tax=Salmo trutta TaxID=8032 RepID=A0A674D3C3_SALTR